MLLSDVLGDPLAPTPGRDLGSAELDLVVGPRRQVLLVDDGDIEQLRAAVLAASTIWGGIRTPIIPVGRDGTIAPGHWQITEPWAPVRLVDLRADQSRVPKVEAIGELSLPRSPARPLDDGHFWTPHPIVAYTPSSISNLALSLPNPGDLDGLIGGGHVDLPDEVDLWREVGAAVSESCDLVEMALAQLRRGTVIEATGRFSGDSTLVSPFAVSSTLVYVCRDEPTFHDAMWFWNLRAVRPRGYDAGTTLFLRAATLAEPTVRQAIQNATRERSRSTPAAVFHPGEGLTSESVADLAASAGFHVVAGTSFSEQIFDKVATDESELTATTTLDPRLGWLGDRTSGGTRTGIEVSWRRPSTSLRFRSPVEWHPKAMLSSPISVRFSGPQFNAPRTPGVAALYEPNAIWTGPHLELSTNASHEYRFGVVLPSGAAVLDAALGDRGATWRVSDKGQQVVGVLQRLSDRATVRLEVFHELVKVATPSRSDIRLRLVQELRDLEGASEEDVRSVVDEIVDSGKSFRGSHDLLSQIANEHRAEAAACIDELIAAELLARGLRVECGVCGLKSFVPMSAGDGPAECPGCRTSASFSLVSGAQLGTYFRLGSLLARLSQNGGLVPMAASALLLHSGAFVIPGANIDVDGQQVEADLLGWVGDCLFIGEAKTSADRLDAAEVGKGLELAVLIGASRYYAVTLDAMSDEAQASLLRLGDDVGVEVVVLDRSRLVMHRG